MVTAQVTDKAEIPAHVPPELVRPIGLTDGPEFLAAPYALVTTARQLYVTPMGAGICVRRGRLMRGPRFRSTATRSSPSLK